MKKLNSVCVYCAMRDGAKSIFKNSAIKLGEALADNDITLVYGGASLGLMGAIADATLNKDGKVIGIIPEVLKEKEVAHTGLTEQHFVNNMHTRKKMMAEKSDAFIVMPGGFGTLDETFEIITWKQIGLHNKTIIILNIDNFYQPFIEMVNHLVENKIVGGNPKELFTVVNTVEEIIPAINAEINQSSDYIVADHM